MRSQYAILLTSTLIIVGFMYTQAWSVLLLSSSSQGIHSDHRRIVLTGFAGILSSFCTPSCRCTQAACLPGDLSPSCIGVYKVPIDENIKQMIGDKEALAKYAPGLNFVPPIAQPKSLKEAGELLRTQRIAADDIASVVAAGRLEEAGIKTLNLIPKLTVAGRLLVEDMSSRNNSSIINSNVTDIVNLRQQQIQTMFQTAEVAWKNVDITIGQGLRGDLGVSAVAQLTILSDIRDAIAALDDFLLAVHQ